MLLDALSSRIPLVSDIPTIIFGADVTHPETGEDSHPSIAAVSILKHLLLERLCLAPILSMLVIVKHRL